VIIGIDPGNSFLTKSMNFLIEFLGIEKFREFWVLCPKSRASLGSGIFWGSLLGPLLAQKGFLGRSKQVWE